MFRALFPALLLLAACSGSTGTTAAAPDSLVGDWAGGFYAKGPQGDPMFEISIAITDDDGTNVVGGFVTSNGDAMGGDVAGYREDANVTFQMTGTKDADESDVSFDLDGTATGTTMQGTWTNAAEHTGSFLVELQ